MIAILILANALTAPQRYTDILGSPWAYSVMLTLVIAELALGSASINVIYAAYAAVYGSGALTEHYPDPAAAFEAFQSQDWDTLAVGSMSIGTNVMMGPFLSLGQGRRAYLEERERKVVAATGMASLAAGWILGGTLMTLTIAAQQSAPQHGAVITLGSTLVSTSLAARWLWEAVIHWSDGAGGGAGRLYRSAKRKIGEFVDSLEREATPQTGRAEGQTR